MSIFKPILPAETLTTGTEHPWSRIIKEVNSNKIKHAHNSVHNPKYPKEKEKILKNTELIKFTVVGDQVTREFLFCANLVKGLYKYRKRVFDVPVIRGVTTVDWPATWNDLKIRYGGLAFCLQSKVAVLVDDKFLGGEQELKQLVETKYTYHLCLDYYKESINEFAKFVRSSGRPFAYMHISINEKHIGTLIFMLYADIVPYTCDNFLRLCKERRGGYSGTPIHRIVKDGWIQGGGFGLKDTSLDCENFIVPHDKRGVLCMANDGRHVDCSTQFFVLLQPAPWMAHKYVAFGQLVEGEGTLKKIEECPTWYEAPTHVITIYKAGIFNMECHDIMINRGANEYIEGHIEDLNALGCVLYEQLLEQVFLTAQFRDLDRQRELVGEEFESQVEEAAGLHATQRFKKEDIEKQLLKSKTASEKPKETAVSEELYKVKDFENNDFDVEEYDYELADDYTHMTLPGSERTGSLVVNPEKPYYIPLIDVKYPGEIDSDFNLRRFLKGDYCLESDLKEEHKKTKLVRERLSFISDAFNLDRYMSDETSSEESLDSEDEKEIRKYLKTYVDSVSFAGVIIRRIAKGSAKFNLFDDKARRSGLITDDNLRKLRLATEDFQARQDKKVSINAPIEDSTKKIKRRQTGFVRPEDLEKIHVIHKSNISMSDDDHDDDDSITGIRRVRIAESTVSTGHRVQRRPTGIIRPQSLSLDKSETEVRPSVLVRLFDDVKRDDEPPTLKDYRPMSELHQKNNLIKISPASRFKSDETTREKYLRHSITVEYDSYEQLMSLQHGQKVVGKISSDYVKTIDQIEHRQDNSIRSLEFAKTRPTMSVSDYQMKNKKYQEDLKLMGNFSSKEKTKGPRFTGIVSL